MHKTFSLAWWSSLSGLMTAIGTLVAIAALVVGIVQVLPHTPSVSPASELAHTPNIGLSFWQNDKLAFMKDVSTNDIDAPVTLVKLTASAFEIRFPELPAESGLAIQAWKDASIFTIVEGTNTQQVTGSFVSPFHPAKGLADTDRTSAILFIDNDAYNFIEGNRADPTEGKKQKVYYSRIKDNSNHGLITPIAAWKKPLYIALWQDRNGDRVLDGGEYEYISVEFQ